MSESVLRSAKYGEQQFYQIEQKSNQNPLTGPEDDRCGDPDSRHEGLCNSVVRGAEERGSGWWPQQTKINGPVALSVALSHLKNYGFAGLLCWSVRAIMVRHRGHGIFSNELGFKAISAALKPT
jgi:hypothetical protein